MTDCRGLVAALRHCCNHGGCNACPAYADHKCHKPMRMAADAIDALVAEIERIRQSSINRMDNWQWRGPQEAGKGEAE